MRKQFSKWVGVFSFFLKIPVNLEGWKKKKRRKKKGELVKWILPEDGGELCRVAERSHIDTDTQVCMRRGLILLNSIAFFSLGEFILATGDTQQRLEP